MPNTTLPATRHSQWATACSGTQQQLAVVPQKLDGLLEPKSRQQPRQHARGQGLLEDGGVMGQHVPGVVRAQCHDKAIGIMQLLTLKQLTMKLAR